MEKKLLIEACEKVLRDLQKRAKSPKKYGEDWNVSADLICNGKYSINIHLINGDNYSMFLGKKPYFNFRLMEEQTCEFLVDENDLDLFIEKTMEIINKQ